MEESYESMLSLHKRGIHLRQDCRRSIFQKMFFQACFAVGEKPQPAILQLRPKQLHIQLMWNQIHHRRHGPIVTLAGFFLECRS